MSEEDDRLSQDRGELYGNPATPKRDIEGYE
jgi:hypothetical protein